MKYCLHCDAKIQDAKGEFCCIGCGAAYAFIKKLRLDKYYKYCRSVYGKSPNKVHVLENELDYLENVEQIIAKDSIRFRSVLLVSEIHCGACVWLIESTLKKLQNICDARVNLSTNRLILEWSGEMHSIHDFVKTIEKLGYRAVPFMATEMSSQAIEQEKDLLKRLTVSGAVSAQVMMLSVAVWAGNMQLSMGSYTRMLIHLLISLITIPAVIYSGMPFFRSAVHAIKSKRSNMDVPISVGAVFATLVSIQETVYNSEYTYYDAAISLIFVLLAGRYLDLKVRNQANAAAHDLVISQPTAVTIVENDKYKLISVRRAMPGQVAMVAVGERIPIDGIIIDGQSEIDSSIITGETLPVKVSTGQEVLAGSVNLSGVLLIKIIRSSDHSALNEIIKLIDKAKQSQLKYVDIAERVAAMYTPLVFSASIITFVVWHYFLGVQATSAILYAVSVLIVTCPCALGLAVPIVQTVATLKLMKNGILLKSHNALERISGVTDIVFDKTGTLTCGKMKWLNKDEFDQDSIRLISSIASHSKHPLMQAVLRDYDGEIMSLQVHEESGMGLLSKIKGMTVKIGNKKWCEINEEEDRDDLYIEAWLRCGQEVRRMRFADTLRNEAKEVVSSLQMAHYSLHLFSGDRHKVVKSVAEQIGIKNYKHSLTPQEKHDSVVLMQNAGKKVLMVGDGLNDSAALKIANASISPSSALAIASGNSDIVFQNDLYSVMRSISIAKQSIKLIKQNFTLSFIYNVLTVPIAMSGSMTPLIAAVAMSSSSIIVIFNAIRLQWNDKR